MKTYWHFARTDENNKPYCGYGDGREIILGETLSVGGELELCHRGLHASERIFDALRYAPSYPSLMKVVPSGNIIYADDKIVARRRTPVAILSSSETNRIFDEFSRMCALSVAHLWDMPNVTRAYLETGDEAFKESANRAARMYVSNTAKGSEFSAINAAIWATYPEIIRDRWWSAAHSMISALIPEDTNISKRESEYKIIRERENVILTAMVESAMEKQKNS